MASCLPSSSRSISLSSSVRKAPQRTHVNCSIRICFRRRVLMSLFSFQGAGAVQRQGGGYWQKHSSASSEKEARLLLFFPLSPSKNHPAPPCGGIEHRPRTAPRQGYCTGTKAKNAQGLEASSGPGLDRAEGGVRATPLPRSNRAPCAKRTKGTIPNH